MGLINKNSFIQTTKAKSRFAINVDLSLLLLTTKHLAAIIIFVVIILTSWQ